MDRLRALFSEENYPGISDTNWESMLETLETKDSKFVIWQNSQSKNPLELKKRCNILYLDKIDCPPHSILQITIKTDNSAEYPESQYSDTKHKYWKLSIKMNP